MVAHANNRKRPIIRLLWFFKAVNRNWLWVDTAVGLDRQKSKADIKFKKHKNCNTFEEKIGGKLLDNDLGNDLISKAKSKVRFYQIKKLLHIKEKQQNEKATY